MPRLHVCSLALIAETVDKTGARSLVTLLSPGTAIERPTTIHPERHLHLAVSDIVEAMPGHVLPDASHLDELLAICPCLGPYGADAHPLFRRRQPLDRRRIHRRLRACARA